MTILLFSNFNNFIKVAYVKFVSSGNHDFHWTLYNTSFHELYFIPQDFS